jgi:uncharacterized protein (TIGR02099 family)
MSRLDEQAARVDALLEGALDLDVSFEALRGRFLAWDPVLEVEGLSLAPPGAEPAVRIGRLRLELDLFETLFRGHAVASAMVVEDLQLDLAPRAEGGWGLRAGKGGALPAPEQIVRFLYQSDYLDLRRAKATLHHEGQAPDRVELDGGVINERFVHRSHLRVRYLPARLGADETDEPAVGELFLDLTGDPLDPADRAGRLVVRLDSVALTPFTRLFGVAPRVSGMFDRLDLRSAFDPAFGVQLRVAATAVSLELGNEAPIRMRNTRLVAESGDATRPRGDVVFRELQTVVGDEALDLDGLRVAWRSEAGRQWFVALPAFDGRSALQLLSAMDVLGPVPTRWLANLAPDAETVGTRLHFDEVGDDWAAAVDLRDLRLQGYRGVPTVRGVDLELVAFDGGAWATTDSGPFFIHFPDVFAEGWQYDSGVGRVDLRWGADGLRVVGSGLEVAGEAGQAAGGFALDIPREESDRTFALSLGIRGSDAIFTERYLPRKLSAPLRDWLVRAIRAGRVPQAAVVVNGRIKPATRLERTAALFFDVEQGRLAFDPSWPQILGIDARVDVDVEGVRGTLRRGRLGAVDLEAADVSLPTAEIPRLAVRGRGRGDGDALISLLETAPLGAASDFLRQGWAASGPVELSYDLILPLDASSAPAAQGSTSGTRGSARIPERLEVELRPALNRLYVPQGRLSFTDLAGTVRYRYPGRFDAEDLTGRLFGGEVRLGVTGDLGGSGLAFTLDGLFEGAELAGWLDAAPLQDLRGVANYSGHVDLAPDGALALRMEAPAAALTTGLPAPMDAGTGTLRVALERDVDGLIDVELDWERLVGRFRLDGDRLLAGSLGLASPVPPLPEFGLLARGRGAQLDVEPWLDTVAALGGGSGGGADSGLRGQALLLDVRLDIDDARWGETAFGPAELVVSGSTVAPSVEFDAPRIAGRVRAPAGDGPLRVELERLDLPLDPRARADQEAQPDAVPAAWLPDDLDTAAMPAMDVDIRAMSLDEAPLGRARFDLRPDATGLVLRDIEASGRGLAFGPDQRGRAEVDLRLRPQTRTRIEGALSGDDLAKALSAWGFAPVVESEVFGFELDLGWDGGPEAMAPKRLEGTLVADIERGRFVQIEGGAARMIGLFNFAAIARRMRFDFSDIYKRGLAFEDIDGALRFGDARLETASPISVVGPSSSVSITGNLDLESLALDGDMIVTLPVSRNLPWAAAYAALLANPLTGAGVLVAERIFRDQIDRFSSARYRIDGTLQAPEVEFDTIFENEASRSPGKPAPSPGDPGEPPRADPDGAAAGIDPGEPPATIHEESSP